MTETSGGRTWIVSNRLPWTSAGEGPEGVSLVRSPGGLVSAMLPVHQAGSAWWVGHGGFPPDLPGIAELMEQERLLDVPVPAPLYDAYYNGAANGCLWPLFHYFPALTRFSATEWQAYRTVNQLFADAVLTRAKSGDLVWVHDYQLMLLPALLREEMPDLRIGYFHHIPFPASEVLKLLPGREEVLTGLLGADLVGFHTLEYARHFASACGRLLDLEVRGERIHSGDRFVRTGAFPLGIDTGAICQQADTTAGGEALAELERTFAGKRLVLGVDRLDYTKGIVERLEAFAEFLRRHPEARRDTVLVQLCVPSRVVVPTYAELRQQIERTVSRINGELGTTGNQPVHYLYQSRDLPELTALYRRADVCLVTPLRDGLNLVSKEYCAARSDHSGMLVISEFAGASEELGEALVVNPFDTVAMAEAIHRGLTMPEAERKERMAILHQRVMDADNRQWADGFITELRAVVAQNEEQATRRLVDADEVATLLRTLPTTAGLLVAIDTDAFATRMAGPQDLAVMVDRLHQVRPAATLLLIGSGPQVAQGLSDGRAWRAAENGARLIGPDGSEQRFGRPLQELGQQRDEIRRVVDELLRKVPRSSVREGVSTITWTMGRIRSDMARTLLQEGRLTITQHIDRLAWHCARIHGGFSVRGGAEILSSAVEAVLAHITRTTPLEPGPVVLLTIGDRCTDDRLFTLLPGTNRSIAIGTPTAEARFLVADGRTLAEGWREVKP